MYNDNSIGVIFITLVLGIFFGLGFWISKSSYQHDTFDCTNVCGGRHSIQHSVNNVKVVCYCEAGE